MPRHTCALCGQISFKYYHEYETYRAIAHGLKTEIKPEIVSNSQEHLDACRCNACFNKKLDALIASQEEALKNQGVSNA